MKALDDMGRCSRSWLHRMGSRVSILLTAVVAAYGFGCKPACELAAELTVLWIVVGKGLSGRRGVLSSLSGVAYLVCGLFSPGVWISSSVLALVLCMFGLSASASGLLLASSLPFVCHWMFPGQPWLMSPGASVCLYLAVVVILEMRTQACRRIVLGIVFAAYALQLVYWALPSGSFNACTMEDVPYGYRIGAGVGKILGCELQPGGKLYYDNHCETPVFNEGAVYLDHDSCTSYDDGVYFQDSPWSVNALIAAEPFRVALAQDGALLLNKGSRLVPGSVRPLWCQSSGGGVAVLGGTDKGHLVIGDADFSCNLLAPYQYHFIRRIAGVDAQYVWWLFGMAVVLITFTWFPQRMQTLFVISSTILLTVVFPAAHDEGGVRYIGPRVLYPHTSQGRGVVRALQKAGFNVMFTDSDAGILVVGRSCRGQVEGERVVVLEPGAEVVVEGRLIRADRVPLGVANGVQDARRLLLVEENLSYDGVMTNGTTIIYASGSPAKIEFKKVL